MSHRYGKIVVAVALTGLLAGSAMAQQRFPFGGFGGGMLLMSPDVQKELKLDDDQVAKAKEVTQQIREKHKDDFIKLKDAPEDQRRQKFQELIKTVGDETNTALKAVLKTEQQKRLGQLELQVRGAEAFSDPELQKKLGISDDQKEKIKTISEDARKEMSELRQNAKGNFEEAMTKMTAIRKETMDKVTAVLKDDQKKTWKDMTGEPFEFKFRRPMRDKNK